MSCHSEVMKDMEELWSLCRKKAEEGYNSDPTSWLEFYTRTTNPKTGKPWSTRNINVFIIGTEDPERLQKSHEFLKLALAKARKEAK